MTGQSIIFESNYQSVSNICIYLKKREDTFYFAKKNYGLILCIIRNNMYQNENS